MIDYAYHLDLIDLALGELNHISLPLILQDDTHVRCEFTSNYVYHPEVYIGSEYLNIVESTDITRV